MIARTHIAFALLVALIFLPYVSNKIVFIPIVLIAALIVDVDSGFSTVGAKVKIVSFFVRHRGIIHSFTFCIFLGLIITVFFPSISLAFFLGYFSHIFIDSFTQEGIMPFWPYTKRSSGILRTGTRIETTIFIVFVLLDLVLIYLNFTKIF